MTFARATLVLLPFSLILGSPVRGEDLVIPAARIAVIEEVDVPARRQGSLASLEVREGSRVEAGTEIGRVDDAAARLAVRRAKLQRDVAEEESKSTAMVELARRALAEARAAVGRAELRVQAAERTAENELAIRAAEAAVANAKADVTRWSVEVDIAARGAVSRVDEDIARKTTEAAQTELDRAVATRRSVGDAVSMSEVNTLTLERDKAKLETDRAVEVREVAGLTETLKSAGHAASRTAVTAAEVGVRQAEFEHAMSKLAVGLEKDDVNSAKLAVETARAKVEQAIEAGRLASLRAEVAAADHDLAAEVLAGHAVVSPVSGVVAERYKNRGEWVEPGEDVVRILRLDRLRAEAFVDAEQIDASAIGWSAVVEVRTRNGVRTLPGEVVHVSLEVETVKNQVIVWVEFDNPGFTVLPGQRARIAIREP